MTTSIVFIAIVAIVFVALLLGKKGAESLRKKLIEESMRQDIKDAATQKKVAEKILRENGQER